MKIRTKNKQVRGWANRDVCPDLKTPVEFDDGVATVTAEVGRAMIAAHPETFSEVKGRGNGARK